MASVGALVCSACVLALLASSARGATEVTSCSGGDKGRQVISEGVNIVGCAKPPCKLKKRSTIELEVQFVPGEDVESVKNNVHALILGVPFPFIGVDGKESCSEIYNEDGSKAQCPLKAGNKYFYKSSFKVLDIYPRIRTDVEWALEDPTKKKLFCFKVPVRIL